MNKKGIELTINFVVMLILGIAMLSGALLLTSKLFTQTEKHRAIIDSQTEQEIRRIVSDTNQLVLVHPKRIELHRNDDRAFGVGVQNLETETEFTLKVLFSKALAPDESELCSLPNFNCDSIEDWLTYAPSQKIKGNEMKTFPVLVSVPKNALKGIYVFDVKVTNTVNPDYGSPKVYVKIV